MACLQINVFIFLISSLLYGSHSFVIAEKALVKVSPSNLNPSNVDTLPSPSDSTTGVFIPSTKQCQNDEFQLTINRKGEGLHSGTAGSRALQSNLMERHLMITSADKAVMEVRDKRSSDKSDAKRRIPKGKQKKAKALGRLLMSSAADKFSEDSSDDYLDDDDDDYSMGLNGEKMNWEDYRNEDGSSVLELIALNARHKKTRMQRANDDEYLY